MLKILRQLPKPPTKRKFRHSDVKHYARAVTGDRIQSLSEDTLTGRFLLYLGSAETPQQVSPLDKASLIESLKSRRINPKSLETPVITALVNTLGDRSLVKNKYEFEDVFQVLDSECCRRSNDYGIEDHFNTLSAFTKVINHKVNMSHYFQLGLQSLIDQRTQLTKEQLIRLIFYIGLLKKDRAAQNMLRQCIMLFNKSFIDSLTKEDLCIICNSTFKTSTKVRNVAILDKIKLYINDNLKLLTDPAVFVTLIKTLRHNRYQDEDILNTITCTMLFNKTLQHYSFSAMCHILALYADYLYYDENILNVFKSKCLEQLNNSPFKSKDAYLNDQPRTKDIKRLLWALSNLASKLSIEDIESVIIPQIQARLEAGEFDKDPGSLVQMCLYLWMMQYKARDFIKGILTADVARTVWTKQVACAESLNLFLTCIYYEDPELFHQLNIHPQKTGSNYNYTVQFAKRPTLNTIVDNLKLVGIKNDIDKFEVGCQVPFINIVGITGYQKKIYKTVHIEVLDEYTCLKNTENVPSGLMQLKLRILDRCDEGLIVIEKQDIADCTNIELNQILEEEIALVC